MKKSYTATFKAQVVLELLKETKTLSQLTSEYGVHATVLRDWKQAALKGLPDVFERRALVEHDADALPLGTQADLLSISRRSLYYQPKPPPPEEVAIKHRIDELYTAHPFYGSRKLTVLLEEHFAPINRKRVQRYMREMGIAGIAPGPNLSKRLTDDRVYPYLLRDITAQHPNHIWGCEIVRSQMTKTHMLTAGTGWDDIADFHITIGDDHSVDQQFDQLAFLLECGAVETSLHPSAEILHRRHHPGELFPPIYLGAKLLILCG